MAQLGRKNVFVLGAGASNEFGLPTGAELKTILADISDIRFDTIGNLQAGDFQLVETLRDLAMVSCNNPDISRYIQGAWQIRDSMPLAPSIDNFLDTHRQNEFLVKFGKIAISNAILNAEKSSLLFQSAKSELLNFPELAKTWVGQLFQILVSGRDFDSFLAALSDITFISFNYDRCVKQFFAHATKQYFALGEGQVQSVLTAVHVIHPYGSVGEYSWNNGQTNFGSEVYRDGLLDVAEGIRTFTEGSDAERIAELRGVLSTADVVVFLGYGFLSLNNRLLFGDELYSVDRVIATGKGLSEDSRERVRSELLSAFVRSHDEQSTSHLSRDDVDIINGTCADLIYEYQRYFSH